MKQILDNLALRLLNDHARSIGLSISGTVLRYEGRFAYSLVRGNAPVLSVQFYKTQVPHFTRYQSIN